ncbi:MAG TPA: response regulator transcription factor [Candidatus Aquilonibacter sp.]|nr:response regulator transcription factor [Candidatus Aquilonibacter sp.]
MRILILENDALLAELIQQRLQGESFDVEIVEDAVEVRKLVATKTYDLLVMDLAQPQDSQLEMLRNLRMAKPEIPIIVLGANTDAEDRVHYMEAGADDFMTKPLSLAELSARIRGLLRRACGPAKIVLRIEDLELDRIQRTVRRGGNTIDLTDKEFVLLDFLMQRPLQPVPRNMIAEQAWKLSPGSITNVVDVYINYLRKKVDFGFERPLIHTVRGVGYQIGG